MAGYKLWLSVQEVPGRHFQATVIVLPDAAGNEHQESETRLLTSRQLAVEAAKEMAQRARERIMKRGDYVSGADFI